MKTLYIVHILEDAAVNKRIKMLLAGGSKVSVAGFFRGKSAPTSINDIPTLPLGRTKDGALLSRVIAMFFAVPKLIRGNVGSRPDIIIARNLECAVLALLMKLFICRNSALVYECLDIHRLVLRSDLLGRFMRRIELTVLRRSKLLILSSPAFATYHFNRYSTSVPIVLVENKILNLDTNALETTPEEDLETPKWQIGWFGIIRCKKSLELLDRLTRRLNGQLHVTIRGKPSYGEIPQFQSIVDANPFIAFEGSYKNPEDLKKIYSEVHFTWAIDYFEEGGNSQWLLPNRLYEGGRYASVPIALANVETGIWLKAHNLGLTIENNLEESLFNLFSDEEGQKQWLALRKEMVSSDPSLWTCTHSECTNLVNRLHQVVISPPDDGQHHHE